MRTRWQPQSQPWRLRLRRRIGETRPGHLLRRLVRFSRRATARRASRPRVLPGVAARPARVCNVLLVSPTDFTGNTALHVYAFALNLANAGFQPAVAVPGHLRTLEDLGRPRFPVVTFRQARTSAPFADGRGPDLVHAFTPRRDVRRLALDLAERHGCAYVVHLEDNERILDDTDRGAAPFLEGASGVTVVTERLLELAPPGVPSAVVWPGFDEAVLAPRRDRAEVRDELRLNETLTLVYNGNVHGANLDDVRSLYEAVAVLRQDGLRVTLVRTGWNFVPRSHLPRLGDGLIELGWVARRHIPDLLAAADVLVQPGRPDAFNDYRFPAKVPEFLASARPVVLPRTNIGLHLRDRVEALLLERGDASEIAEKIAQLASDPELRANLGAAGRSFALRELRWSSSVSGVVSVYRQIEGNASAPARVE